MTVRVESRCGGAFARSGRTAVLAVGLVLIAFSIVNGTRSVWAANPPSEFADVVVADELFAPVQLAMAPDGRLVVLTDSGRAQLIKKDQLQATPFFDIRNKVDDFADRGLLSMAFDNNFAVNGFVYVMYTFDTNGADDGIGETRLVRMTVNGDTASNEVVLFDNFPAADVALHYGGAVEMGPDGKLYVTVGDHLIGANGQDRSNIKGTVLRLNPNGTIPTDNPFYDELTGTSRAIYAYGLRNPWQTAKHPVTGEIFISDVGSDEYEELNVLSAGANYGWFLAEGPKDPNDPAQAGFVDPLWAFPHFGVDQNAPFEGCAIVGGSFYETPNPTFPQQYRGQYFSGDYCTGRIVTVDPVSGQSRVFMDGFVEMVDMAVSPVNGDLYYIDRSFNGDNAFPKGGVGKITYVGQQTDIVITSEPSDVSIAVGGTASFFVGVSAPGDVTYQWKRNGVPIAGEVGARLTLDDVSAADDLDAFTVVISNGQQSIESAPAALRITSNTVPVPSIIVAGADDGYSAGFPIGFSGSATDAEDGTIPAADLRWEIRLNHADHDHALANGVVGATGSFTVPPAIETSTNVWVTLYLTATDSDGTSTTVTARVDPKIVTITLDSDPSGLNVIFEGAVESAPFAFQSVSGVEREIGAPAQQSSGGLSYNFASWSDGLGRNQVRATPASDMTWTASYTTVAPPVGEVCTVVALGGGVRVSWQDQRGTEVVRNAGGWVTTPAAGTLSYDDPVGSLGDGWLIRRSGVDEVCEGGVAPPVAEVCVVRVEVVGGVTLTWDNQPGTEIIRNSDGWVVTPPDGTLSYTDPNGSLNDGWFVRRTGGGDEPCIIE